MVVRWPRRCAPLMVAGQPDSFVLRFSESISRARYEVILPAGREAFCEPIGFGEDDPGFALEHWEDTEKRPTTCSRQSASSPGTRRG